MLQGFPAVFVLTDKKSTEIYTAIWQKLFILVPQLRTNIRGITSDFERAQLNSAKRNFPEARVTGCLFHFKQV